MPSRRHILQTGSSVRPIFGPESTWYALLDSLDYTRRFFGGRQPLCGSGVTSSIALIIRPDCWSAVTADSRPDPGPLIRTSTSFRPNFEAFSAHVSAARWAANGVLLRLPLKPTVPAEAVQSVSPLVSVMVMIVLLNVAWMWATPRLTFRRALRFLLFATCSSSGG